MEPNLILITIAAIVGATGIALIFVGFLMAILVALGNKQYVWGLAIFVLFPSAYIYSWVTKDQSNYAGRLLWIGLALVLAFAGLIWWELDRLGLDFLEIMKSATPTYNLK